MPETDIQTSATNVQASGAPKPDEHSTPQPLAEAEKSKAKTPPWGDDENFNAEKAWDLIQNLRAAESRGRDAMEKVDSLEKKFESTTAERNKALAEALGLTETPKSADDLAETVKGIQQKLAASELESTRLKVAAEHKIPAEHHDLLTETDTEKLKAQAAKIAKLLEASATPAFQPNPGQGQQSGGTSFDAQIAEAEKAGDTLRSISLKQQRAASLKKP